MIIFEDENNSLQRLITSVYPSFDDFFQSKVPSMNKANLTTKNEYADDINNTLIQIFPHEYIQIFPHEYTPFTKSYDFINSGSLIGNILRHLLFPLLLNHMNL